MGYYGNHSCCYPCVSETSLHPSSCIMKTSKRPDKNAKLPQREGGSLPPISPGSLTDPNEMEETEDFPDEGKVTGVKYISEDLIKRVTKQDDLNFVQNLNLCGSKSDKKIRYIENLEKCEKLLVLNLSHNMIQKMEKMDRLHRLRELDLSHNRICKMEGLQHMGNLQQLNLSFNLIENVPLWIPKKLRSLTILNLQDNSISALHELCRLKSLVSLSQLVVGGNPVSALSHHRPLLIYHLRAIQLLDHQPVTQQDREEARERFHMEEVARLERELDQRGEEVERLRGECEDAVAKFDQQVAQYDKLKQQSQQQQQQHRALQTELDTKTELLKQKSVNLTRACQKHYKLEQELAFLKIDAKFSPLPFYPSEEDDDIEVDSGLNESPYIGRSRQHRKTASGDEPDTAAWREAAGPHRATLPSGGVEKSEEERLRLLQMEIRRLEQQIHSANQELQGLEDTANQKRMSEAEKEQVRQRLLEKLEELKQDQAELQSLEAELQSHNAQMAQAHAQMDMLNQELQRMSPTDPHYAHLNAQLWRQQQLLDMMSARQQQLEERLDYMLNRIAQETQDIKELEQQLTDGQILANEALKRELEDVISGLQEYLAGVRGQAQQAQSECLRLQNHNQALQSLLQDQDEQLQQLQPMQMELDLLRVENAELSEAMRESGLGQSDQEERSSDAQRTTAELNRLRSLSKVERAALEAELENERQARENAEVRMQLETENLLEHINSLKEESDVLREQAAGLQAKLQSSSDVLIHPEHLLHRLQQLSMDPTADTPHASDMVALGNSAVEERLRELQQEAWRLLRAAREEAAEAEEEKEAQHLLQEQDHEEEWRRLQEERDEARAHQETLSKELQHLKHQIATMQKHNQLDRGDAAVKNREHEMDLSRLREELQKEQEAELQRLREELSRAHDVDLQQLKGRLEARQRAELSDLRKRLEEAKEAELQGLREELQEAQEQQYLMSQRLQEAEGEKEGLLAELREKDMQAEELKRSMEGASGQQLNAVTQQLQALYKTAVQIRQQREQDAELLRRSRQQACELEGDLQKAEAETTLLHTLLKDGPVDSKAKAGPASSYSYQPDELENLARAVRRLTEQLNQASTDKSVSVEKLMDEMVSLRDTLKQGSNISSPKCSGHRNSQRYYIPAGHSAASLASQGTQDSGLGSQLPSSPPRKPRPQHRPRPHKNHPKGDGYWLYSLHPPSRVASDSTGESDPESGAPWWFFPAGALLYTSLPAQQPPPPPAPPSPHCNLPSHQRMERDLREAKRDLREQRGLERESKELQREIQQLRREHKRLRARVASGERSALEEVECLEETLRQRRAELREADRLLLHTHAQLKDKRAQSKEEGQRCREAQRRREELQQDLQEMESRAQDYAKQLLHSRQHLSMEQEELQKLQHQRQSEDRAVTSADAHYKQLKQRLEENERLLLKAEDLLSQRNTELQSLNTELGALERRVGQWREEERLLQETLQQHRHTLLQELTQAEDEKHTLHTHIKELRVCEEDLSKQQRDVEEEVCEGRSLLKLIRQELQQEKQALDTLTSELKRVQEEKQEHESQCEQLQEKCRHLEARQRHAQRCASNTEKALCEARADLARLHNVLEESRDNAGLSTELRRRLEEEQSQLDAVRQAIQSACCERDGLLEERDRVRGEVESCVERGERGHTRLQQLEEELKELDTQLSHKHTLLQQHQQTLGQQQQEWADEEAVQQQRRQQLQAQLQALEGAVAERVQRMEHLTAEEAELQDRRRLLHTEEEQHRLKGQELCEWESRLDQQQRELEGQRGELEGQRSKLHKLQSHLKRQTHTLQHTQQAAKESEQRADTLQTELHTVREELQSLREKQEKERCIVLETRRSDRCSVPKPEPELSVLTVGDLQSPSPPHSPSSPPPSRGSSSGGEDGDEDQLRALLTPSRMSALAAQDEQRRGELLREQLEMHEDELKAQLRRRMFDQQEALCVRRQQTEGSLDDLRRRLDWLDQLLGDETALKTLKQHKVRLSSSWHSGSSEPFYHPVKLERPQPQREMS
ncbi:centriolin isoform X3 [Engraulis encrasicolus]|uniref:centriolin isoform X3 n=1 Tax=Engraulis encrasicolus TaxID=184585 RepID=UPI002FD59E7F